MSLSLNLSYGEHAIRVAGTRERPEWVAADVCAVLGIGNPSQTLSRFRPSEKGITNSDTPLLTVTEPGLYRLVFKSRKPEAEKFRDWVTHEVLPSIRQYGCYPPPEVAVGDRSIVLRSADMTGLANAISAGIGQHLRQTNDRIEMLEGAVTTGFDEMGKRIDRLEKRRPLTEPTKRVHLYVVFAKYAGACPCCRNVQILNENGGKLTNLNFDHARGKSKNAERDTWPVCESCNRLLENGDKRIANWPHFESYQLARQAWRRDVNPPLSGLEDIDA